MRIFFSTGEPSGELCATALASEISGLRSGVSFEGIGGERMRAAGFTVTVDTRGWATLGPIAAIRNIPRLILVQRRVVRALIADPPDLVVLLDFGAFNVRLARGLRHAGYQGPIFYGFPPSAWLDRPNVARIVAQLASPVVPFAHQRDFYRSLGLEPRYFGHPIAATIASRTGHVPSIHGRFVFLPGSRRQEIGMHLPRMLGAIAKVRGALPQSEIVIVAADSKISAYLRGRLPEEVRIEREARVWLSWADVACVASGTAVLESVLLGVPTVAMYVLSPLLLKIAKRMYNGRFVTIPNLILDRMAIPELLQDEATPKLLAQHLLSLARDADDQRQALGELRTALESNGAMRAWAEYALALVEQTQ